MSGNSPPLNGTLHKTHSELRVTSFDETLGFSLRGRIQSVEILWNTGGARGPSTEGHGSQEIRMIKM